MRKAVVMVMTIILVVAEVLALGLKVRAAAIPDYEYEAVLDLSSKGWSSYFSGSCREMTGNTGGEIKGAATLYVLNEAKNSKGNLIAYVYSPDLGKKVYVASRFLKKVGENSVEKESVTVDIDSSEKVSKMVEGIFLICPRANENASLDVQDWGTEAGTNCQIWSTTGAENQLFRITKTEEGYWKIQSLFNDMFLASGEVNKHYPIANAVFMEGSESENQEFEIVFDEVEGYFNVIHRGTGYSLYVAKGDTADGTNVCLIPANGTDAQDFSFVSVFVENDDIYANQKRNNTCTLASAAMMIRRKLWITGQDISACTEESTDETSLRKVAWGRGLKNSFQHAGYSVSCFRVPEMDDEEMKAYLIDFLKTHQEGFVGYCKDDLAPKKNPHAVYVADYNAETDEFMVYDPSGFAPDELVPLSEATFKVSNKLQGVDVIWYIND